MAQRATLPNSLRERFSLLLGGGGRALRGRGGGGVVDGGAYNSLLRSIRSGTFYGKTFTSNGQTDRREAARGAKRLEPRLDTGALHNGQEDTTTLDPRRLHPTTLKTIQTQDMGTTTSTKTRVYNQ
eukprot:5651080-Amphidinium_carterae.1